MKKHLETAGQVERMLAEASVLVAQSTVELVQRCRTAEAERDAALLRVDAVTEVASTLRHALSNVLQHAPKDIWPKWLEIRDKCDAVLYRQGENACQYCDGTGDVHTPTGEWRGVCTECAAGASTVQPSQQQPTSPDVQAALLFALWHHQGGSSKIGQPIRAALGIGVHDHLSPEQLDIAKRVQSAIAVQPSQTGELKVWFGAMPESNGKSNWTAILHKGDLADGFQFGRSEYKDRVRYDADSMRHLIGELPNKPDILAYDGDLKEDCRAAINAKGRAIESQSGEISGTAASENVPFTKPAESTHINANGGHCD